MRFSRLRQRLAGMRRIVKVCGSLYCRVLRSLLSLSCVASLVVPAYLYAHSSPTSFHHESMPFTRIMPEDMSDNDENIGAVFDVIQDQKGYMWFAGGNGVARFDGRDFEIFRHDPNDPNTLNSNDVFAIVMDHDGVIWIGTRAGLNRYDDKTGWFTSFDLFNKSPQASFDSSVRGMSVDQHNNLVVMSLKIVSIIDASRQSLIHLNASWDTEGTADFRLDTVFVDQQNRIWLSEWTRGLSVVDLKTKTFSPDFVPAFMSGVKSTSEISRIYEDKRGRFWVLTLGNGVLRITPEGSVTHFMPQAGCKKCPQGSSFWEVLEDADGEIWLTGNSDQGGLHHFDQGSETFTVFKHDPYDARTLNNNNVRVIFEDRRGDFWVTAYPAGINYHNRSHRAFKNIVAHPNGSRLSNKEVLSLKQSKDGILWVGTENGLNAYDVKTDQFTHYLPDENNDNSLKAGPVLSIDTDKHDDIWLGMWGGGVDYFDRKKAQFHNFNYESMAGVRYEKSMVWKVLWDNDDLWVGTHYSGLIRVRNSGKNLDRYTRISNTTNSLSHSLVTTMFKDSRDDFWVGTLDGLNIFQPESENFIRYQNNGSNQDDSFNGQYVYAIVEDNQRRIWIATSDSGIYIYYPNTQRFKRLGMKDGLPSETVASLLMSDERTMWATTSSGLARINTYTYAIDVFKKHHGLVSNHFNRDASWLGQDGKVYLGSAEGLSIFDPYDIELDDYEPPLLLTKLLINGKVASYGDEDSPLTGNIEDVTYIRLNHEQRTFALEFSSIDFRSAKQTKFAYQLVGLDSDWVDLGRNNQAVFSYIAPGSYHFRLKATNGHGIWYDMEKPIHIVVSSAPWATWWAYGVYATLVLLVVWFIVRTRIQKIKFDKERSVNQELRKLNNLKTSFLVNTSHEFRTPLNGVVGLSEVLLDHVKGYNDSFLTSTLESIGASGRRLSYLMNDILDFSRLQNDELYLKLEQVDIAKLVDDVVTIMRPFLKGKSVVMTNHISGILPPLCADYQRVQQVLINLLSNAIKYTESGEINISHVMSGSQMSIIVSDTGVGISQKDQKEIFNAFSQAEQGYGGEKGGFGMGLAFVKKLLEKMEGDISVASIEGQGAEFSFVLPIYRGGVCAVEKRTSEEDVEKYIKHRLPEVHPTKEKKTILVVDDDHVNRLVLKSILKDDYHILEASDGVEAINTVDASRVDIVLLDIMMPRMNGFDACRKIREQHSKDQLPIIFVTARNLDEDHTVGFEAGGNEFVCKPVTKDKILASVKHYLCA